MNKHYNGLTLFLLSFFIFLSCQKPKEESTTTNEKWYIGSKQNYIPPKTNEALPKGYQLKFISNVARHGSRYMSGPSEDVALFHLMEDAHKENQLTANGNQLFLEVKKMIDIQTDNYGKLTALGKEEHYDMAQRLYQLSPTYFDNASTFVGNATYKSRTQNSRGAFIKGLKEKGSKALWGEYNFEKGNDPLLRFHKISPKYKAYVDSTLWETQIEKLVEDEAYLKLTQSILPKYFKSSILNEVTEGKKFFKDGEGEIVISSQMDIILALYECLKISFAIPQEQRPNFLIFTPEETKLLAKLGDIEAFYEKGPGFKNRRISYANSTPLLMNITHTLELASQNTLDYQGYFNFAHAETTLPLVVLLNLNNISQKSDNLLNKEWSEGDYACMGSNIQWFLLEKEGEFYVQIRFNEKPASLPIASHSDNVYPLEEYINYVEKLVSPNLLSNTDYLNIVKTF